MAYAKGIGVCSSAVNSYFKALKNHNKTYKKVCTKGEPSKDSTDTTKTSDSSESSKSSELPRSDLEITHDYIDLYWREIGICKDCKNSIVYYDGYDSDDY